MTVLRLPIARGVLIEGYGLTESSPVTHCNPLHKSLKTVKIGSNGLTWLETDAKIMDMETGQTRALGLKATKMKASGFCFVSFQAKTSRKQK